MQDAISRLSGEQFLGLMAILTLAVAVTLIVAVGVVVPLRHNLRRAELDTQLKQDLIAGNFTADEIERIVLAKGAGSQVSGRNERASGHKGC